MSIFFEKKILFLPVFIFLIIVGFVAHLGFSVDDGGYMYGLGWRVLTGENIYSDFLYPRPPFSVFFNAFLQLIVPDMYEYYIIRIVFFTMIFLYSVLSILLLKEYTKHPINSYVLSFLISIAFLFNIHTNNYMWHTVDGIFFLVLGFYFLFSKTNKFKSLYFGFTFLFLGLLAKQSFLLSFLVILGIYFLLELSPRKKSLISFLLALCTIVLFFYILGIDYKEMLLQMNYASSLSDLFQSGVYEYLLKGIVFWFFLIIIASMLFFHKTALVFNSDKPTEHFIALMAASSLVIKPVFVLLANIVDIKFFPSMLHMSLQFDFILIFLYVVISFWKNKFNFYKKEGFVWISLLMIAWGASISWGYQTPIFFSGIFIFMLYIMASRDGLFNDHKKLLTYSLAITIPIWITMNYYIVNDRHWNWPSHDKDLGFVSEKLRGIYVNDEKTLQNILFIVSKANECPGSYAVKYSHTYLHWALNDVNQISLDWISKAEAVGREQMINEELSRVDCIIEDKDYRFLGHKRFGWEN